MISLLKYLAVISVVSLVIFGLPKVDTLPLGLDDGLIFVVQIIHGLLNVIPPLQVVWTLFIWYLYIEFLLWSWHLIKWFISLAKS